MEAFLHPLQGLAEFGEIKKRCGANCGILNVSGCMESQKVHLMYGLSGLFPYHLILADDERNAKEIYEDYRFYDKNNGKRYDVVVANILADVIRQRIFCFFRQIFTEIF